MKSTGTEEFKMTEFYPDNSPERKAEISGETKFDNNEHLEKKSKNERMPSQEELRSKIEKYSNTKEQMSPKEANNTIELEHYRVTWELKQHHYAETLNRVRKELKPIDKVASKFIHRDVIEETSETLGRTIVRPITIIITGVIALLASVILLIIAKTIGFALPSGIIIIFFFISYAIGLLSELIIYLFHSKRT